MIKSQKLLQGMKVEMEHAHHFPKNLQASIAKKIAQDHLKEDSNYYTKLKKAGL
jgi:hypothetical protein